MLGNIAENNGTIITLDDSGLFMQRHTLPILIDEIQYAPELLPYIKMAVDKNKKNGDYWLTGSQPFHLIKNVSESLAVGIINLLGLSNSEINGIPSKVFNFGKEPPIYYYRDKDKKEIDLLILENGTL